MKKEEAIKIIDCYDIGFYDLSGAKIPADKLADAFDMAIEALSANAVAVVRCKDCQYRKKVGTSYYCDLDEFNVKDADFCSWGEREGGTND